MPVRSALFAFAIIPITALAQEAGPAPRELRFDPNGYPLPPGAVLRLGSPPPLTDFSRALAWTPDGREFVAADANGTTVFDAASGRIIRVLPVGPDATSANPPLAYEARSVLRLNGNKGTLTDTATGDILLSFTLPSPLGDPGRRLYSLNLSADQRFLAGIAAQSGTPGVAWRYDLARGRYTRLVPDRADLHSMRLAPDGKRVFAVGGTADPELTARDVATCRDLWTISLQAAGTIRAISRDGRRLAVTDPGGLTVFDTATGRRAMSVSIDSMAPASFWGIDLAPDGSRIALADGEKVIVRNVATGAVEHRLIHPAARLAVFAPDGKSLLTASAWVQRWDLDTGKAVFPPPLLEKPTGATVLKWSGDGRRLLAAWIGERTDDLLTLWDVATGDLVWKLRTPEHVQDASVDRDGATVRGYAPRSILRSWNAVHPEQQTVSHVMSPDIDSLGLGYSFHPDGRFAIHWLESNGIRLDVYDAAGRCELRRFRSWRADANNRRLGQNHMVQGTTAFGPGGWRFDLVAGREIPPLAAGPTARMMNLLVSDSRAVVGGRAINESTIEEHLWESLTGGIIGHLPKDVPHFAQARISADGRFLAVAADTEVLLHDFKNPGTTVRLPAVKTSALAFSPDASLLATAQPDGTILVWKVPRQIIPWQPSDADRLWSDLASSDARRAWRALWHLTEHPEQAVVQLRGRLRPEAGPTDTAQQIARLDHPKYAVREQATRELTARGNLVEGDLLQALQAPRSEEQRTRIERLLQNLTWAKPPTGASLRGLRCIWLLEHLGTAEARKVLEELAKGASGSRVTTEARNAVDRLAATR